MSAGRVALAAALALLAAGCRPWQTQDPVTPVSYERSYEQVPRNLGRLRRLAFVPLVEPLPDKCAGSYGDTPVFDDRTSRAPDVTRVLVEQKGYEIEPITDANSADLLATEAEGRERLVKALQAWVELDEKPPEPGSPGHVIAVELVRRHAVDGILLVRFRDECASMAVFWANLKAQSPQNIPSAADRVVLLEAATLRPVFRAGGWGWLRETRADRALDQLEPAIPKLLTGP